MADYKAIKGHNIQTVAGDPSTLALGDIWYSSVTKKIRGVQLPANGSWSTGGAINTGRGAFAACGTTSTAGLVFGGETPPPKATETEEYNGTAWSEQNDLNTARSRNGGCGTQTAGLCVAGNPPANVETESYDGSSWTELADCNTGRGYVNVFGTSTAAVSAGGTPGTVTECEEWNGTSWTEVTDIPAHIYGGGTAGTLTNGMVFCGQPPPNTRSFEYDGTNWTAGGGLNQAKMASNGFGESQTTATSVTGSIPQPTVVAHTEEYDGSSWTEVADLSTARESAACNGTRASGFVAGGMGTDSDPNSMDATEEWDKGAAAASFTSS